MNKECFLQLAIKPKKITVKELNNAEIYVKPLSYALSVSLGEIEDTVQRAVLMVVQCVCDEHGQSLFSNTEEDIELISNQFTYHAIVEIAGKISQITMSSDEDLVK